MNNTQFDTLLYLASRYAGKPELDLYDNASEDFVPSKKFERRMMRFIKRVNRQEKWNEWKSVTTPLKRIAVAAMLICTISLGAILSIKAIREAIWGTIVEWYEKSIAVMFVTDDDVSMPTVIREYKEPRAGLDEYERYEVTKNESIYTLEYENNKTLILYRQSLVGDASFLVSNNDTIMHDTVVNKHSAVYFEYVSHDETFILITWNDESYQYSLEGNISMEKLKVIAESVK